MWRKNYLEFFSFISYWLAMLYRNFPPAHAHGPAVEKLRKKKSDTTMKQVQVQTQRAISTSSLLISLSGYSREQGIIFSTLRDLSIQDIKGASTLNVEFKKYDFNKLMDFPYTVPSNYKVGGVEER